MTRGVSSSRLAAALRLECERLGREFGGVQQAEPDVPIPILVKGPAIARHFPEPAQRTYKDIDLLVPSTHVEFWASFLEQQGYRRLVPKKRRHQLFFTGEVKFVRPFADTYLMSELHVWFFADKRARKFNYEAVRPDAGMGPSGLLEPSVAKHLVILALHYRHHPPQRRKDSWLKDFLELGNAEAVAEARQIAAVYSIEWMLEQTLYEAQILAGSKRWGAESHEVKSLSLARVTEKGHSGPLLHLALWREFGILRALGYLLMNSNPA